MSLRVYRNMVYCKQLFGILARSVKQLYSVCCLIGHMFKVFQWCNVSNTNMTPKRNIRNLSLAYPNICEEPDVKLLVYSEPFQTSKVECFATQLTALRQLFSQNAPSQISDRVLNTPLIIYIVTKKEIVWIHGPFSQNFWNNVNNSWVVVY